MCFSNSHFDFTTIQLVHWKGTILVNELYTRPRLYPVSLQFVVPPVAASQTTHSPLAYPALSLICSRLHNPSAPCGRAVQQIVCNEPNLLRHGFRLRFGSVRLGLDFGFRLSASAWLVSCSLDFAVRARGCDGRA